MRYQMRSCGGHAGFWLTHQEPSLMIPDNTGGEPFLCPKCVADQRLANETWMPTTRDHCHVIGHTTGPFSDLIVAKTEGDRITVFPLGCPDRSRTLARNWLIPGRFGIGAR